MYKKSWLIPITVLLFCILAMVSYQKSNELNTYAASAVSTQMDFGKKASDITEVVVTWPNTTLIAKREGTQWQITAPTKAAAEGSYIYDIINNFIKPGNLHLIEENIENPSAYGINPYSTHITLYDDNHSPYELIQGNTFNKDYYYAYSPTTNALHAVPRRAFDALSKNLTDWYDKNYIHFVPSSVQSITVTRGELTHLIEPQTTHNRVTFTSTTLPTESVEGLIRFLSTSRAQGYVTVDASPQVIDSYQLGTNALHITITNLDGTTLSIAIASDTFESSMSYVLLKATNTIITVPQWTFHH